MLSYEVLVPPPPTKYFEKEIRWGEQRHRCRKWGEKTPEEDFERARNSLTGAIEAEVEDLKAKKLWTPEEYLEFIERVQDAISTWEEEVLYNYMTYEGRRKFREEVIEHVAREYAKEIEEHVYGVEARDERIRRFEEFMYENFPKYFSPAFLQICDFFFSDPDLVRAYAEGRKSEVYDALEETTGYSRSTIRMAFTFMRKAGIIEE